MKNVLDELWYGNVCPNTDCREKTKEAREQLKTIADLHDKLYATLTEKQKEMLENFEDSCDELTDINEREIFAYAFRLGAKIAFEIMRFGAN